MGGNDTVYGGPDGDGSAPSTDFSEFNLEGGQDSDKVYGGGGNDYIDAAANDNASPGQPDPVDRSFGGRGNDHINAVDGKVDIINCGKGDVANIDGGIDANIRGCETKNEFF